MATIDVSVRSSKELTELLQGGARFLGVAFKALKDGVGPEDIAPILTAAMAELPALDGYEKIDDEIAEDPVAAINAFVVGGGAIWEEIKKSL